MKNKHNLSSDFAVMDPNGRSQIWNSKDFWSMATDPAHKDNKKDMGYLVSEYEFSEDWQSWENHPNGDEFVYCISGEMTFVIRTGKALKKVRLGSGQFLVVPKNTWHTAKVAKACRALFMTWGYGTKHKEI